MEKYNHKEIEAKWQKVWDNQKIFEVKEPATSAGRDKNKPKFYGLIEFPYASGEGLHVGHLRSYTAMDVICRKKRMEKYNVLYPIGFDNFGLPTENYAVKKKINPKIIDKDNTKTFTRQLKEAGFGFDWSRCFSTTDEDYYKWTQWIFIQMFKNGLAYKSKEAINWCTSCKVGLANEEVVGGKCERCGGEVVKKEKEQWVLRITKYADRLIDDLDQVDYLEKIKTQQINWIGRSEGAEVSFKVVILNPDENRGEESRGTTGSFGLRPQDDIALKVFTTRPDTLFGATFMVVAPEHEIIRNQKSEIRNWDEVEKYIEESKKKSDLERTDLNKEKTGMELQGIKAINPVNNKEIPIFVADYVLTGYGTGAIMAVPAHDQRDWEFAKKYNLEIIEVVKDIKALKHKKIKTKEECFISEGIAINSGEFDGLTTTEFKEKITTWLEEKNIGKKTINYKLHDWIFSRQRYWGEPIPMVNCEKCGWVPIPESDLPVILPEIEDFMPTDSGDSPLAKATGWINTKCPNCGGEAKRETDVMPNWAGSNWYFIRYCDPKNNKIIVDPKKAKYWLPVDWYSGGMEHTTLHLLYSRFVWKFLYDINAVPKECGPEPYKKRTAHGMVLGEGGIKMSKSKGNVINPDDYVQKFGADTVRLYEMFMGPFDQQIPWDDKGVVGVYRFLQKIWNCLNMNYEDTNNVGGWFLNDNHRQQWIADKIGKTPNDTKVKLHKTIKKVTEDIEEMRFNTAISAMMIFINSIYREVFVDESPGGQIIEKSDFELFLLLLSPFAPHFCEEIWSQLGHKKSILLESWPEYDPKLIVAEEMEIAVQINGKVRDRIMVLAEVSESEVAQAAMKSEKVQKWLADKEPKKMIYVKNKLISIVV